MAANGPEVVLCTLTIFQICSELWNFETKLAILKLLRPTEFPAEIYFVIFW